MLKYFHVYAVTAINYDMYTLNTAHITLCRQRFLVIPIITNTKLKTFLKCIGLIEAIFK